MRRGWWLRDLAGVSQLRPEYGDDLCRHCTSLSINRAWLSDEKSVLFSPLSLFFCRDRRSAKAHRFIRPPFAHLVVIYQMHNSFPPGCGRHH